MITNSPIHELRKFVAPEFIFGCGARNQAARYAKNFGAHRVLIVTDPGIISAGWVDPLISNIKAAQLDHFIFENVSPNPHDEEVMEGAAFFQKNACDLIIAIGGGSPMDCAKGIGIVSSNNHHILTFEGVDEVPIPAPPLICIPSTSGTSADVSQFAIINDTLRKVKIAIISKTVVPDAALIDPEVTCTMDPYLTACTGMDALTHAFEAYVSNAHSPITDLHALQAVRLVKATLLRTIQSPKDIDARSQMMLASLHAGLAFSNASLGAVHAMAHSMGGLLDLPHGECNALLLEHVVNFNFSEATDRYNDLAAAMELDTNKSALIEGLIDLRESVGITKTLGNIGVKTATIHELASKAIQDPCMATNPRTATQKDIEGIYAAAL
ncbi:MAG: alcohol dehydrogenase-like regulatory protein ErcA [Anaerolineaceae bacterium]